MKIHLGCGNKFIPGFVHIDAIPFDHVQHVSSVENLNFIASNTVDLIYTCHVLEHFRNVQVPDVLGEWQRVLRPGGILRLAVPDFSSICRLYSQTQDLSLCLGPLYGRQDYLYNFHYTAFDFSTLETLLIQAGFANVHRYDWRETEHSHIFDYSQAYRPHLDFENGILMSLNVEAVCT
jgi:SAM-dependent methyltransferase